jgi:hypothetical protein
LAAGGGVAANGNGDFFEVSSEHIVGKERGAFQRRETLQGEHQRQSKVVEILFRILHDGFREPHPDVGFAPVPGGFQPVETESRDHAPKKRFGFADGVTVDAGPSQERVLNDIFGVGNGSKHAVCYPDQVAAKRCEGVGGVLHVGGSLLLQTLTRFSARL